MAGERMLLEMGLIVGGVPFGWMGRKSERVIASVGRGLTWSVRLMLFLLGLSLGADATLVARMRTLGLRAAVISTLSVLGCVVAAWALGRFVLSDAERGSVSSGTPLSQSPYSGKAPGKTPVDGTAESGIGGSLLVLAFFFAGALAGRCGLLPLWIARSHASTWVLYLLLFAAGMSVGFDLKALGIIRELKGRILLVPFGVAAGTLCGSALAWLILARWVEGGLAETLAVGAGFGYYSLATVIMTQLGDPALGSVALLSNMIHEVLALTLPPIMVRTAGRLAPVMAGGAAAMDTCLPVIARYSGERCAILAVFSGMCLTLLVPLIVPALMALR